tara:strand:- start:787 stop:1020 length:234 start_codon:yes stop_codon:yes gene_type:complete
MGLFKNKPKQESLIDFTDSQFKNNSLLVNYTKNASRKLMKYSIIGTKKVLPSISKMFDYGVISLFSILIYNFVITKI